MKIFDFNEQLIQGNKGEQLFLSTYLMYKKIENGGNGDFYDGHGQTVELKYETRTTKQTPNIFFERYRNENKAPGGVHQAFCNAITFYVVLFSDNIIYWFNTWELVKHLDIHAKNYEQRTIQNKGWSALGYLVPRASLEDLIVKKERLNERD